ncbi:PAS domain S-box protein [Fulvivirga sp. RKSG066]|uniref:PAS domain-containing sensor histidine kinase n=1 Tax=Fulvivirga aurantia TaxID=2529383 RepID=UPI0012BBC239|nr:PAS domain-containing protein [Fulvivirga aurantia]MTI22606.1 PAS domain S-box protein [Fulvivirga aurantia]
MSANHELLLLSDLPQEVEEFANLGVWHYDIHSKLFTLSPNLYNIFQVSKERFKGTYEAFLKLVHPKDVEMVEEIIDHSISKQSTFTFDHKIVSGRGNIRHIRTWGLVITNDDDKAVRITGLSMDISESREYENALRENEQFSRKLIQYTPNAIIIQNLDGEILYANKTAAELIKAPSVDYLMGKNTASFRQKDNEAIIQGRINYILNTGEAAPKFEQTYICVDGSKKIGESVVIPFEYKKQDAILSIITDVTEQKKAIGAVKRSETQLRYFISNTPLAVAMYDMGMNYIACSQQFLDDWWVKDEEMTVKKIIGLNHYELFPDVTSEWKTYHQRALKGENITLEVDVFIKSDGKKEWVRSKNQPWYLPDGEIGGMILFTEFITDRKEAENEILNSRNRLSTLIQNLPGLVYSCGPAPYFTLLFVSSGAYDMTGYKPEDFVENGIVTFDDIVHPDDLKRVRQIMINATKKREPFEVSYRIYTKSGQLKYLNERGQAIFDAGGTMISIEGVVMDITQKMEADEEARKNKERLYAAQRISHLGSWEYHLPSDEVFWSDEYFRICGEEPQAFIPTFEIGASYIHPDDRKVITEAIQNTIKTGEPYTIEKRIVRRDRSVRYVVSHGELITDDTGNPVKVIGSMQDITERKLTEMALQESQNRNTAIINALPDILFITSIDGTYLDSQVSDPTKLFLPSESFIGKNVRDIMTAEISEQFIEKSKIAEKTDTVQIMDYSVDIQTEKQYFEARIVKYEEGKVLSMIRNITTSKKNETQLVKLTEELTTTNAELKQFAYITSHDLRAPVVNLDTLLQLYKNESNASIDKPMVLDKIVTSVEQLKSTLNDLIQLVAVKDDTANDLTKVDLAEITNRVISNLETQIKQANATIKSNFEKAPFVIAKKATTYSILQNLVSNALKYHGSDPPHIEIESTILEDYTCLSVTDNGVGIDLDTHGKKLFGMYQRFHINKEGKGLGLYIIKSQIEALGGFIEVKSEVGKGSTFNVCFKRNTE